ncbi:MAG: RNA polymerase sigma factor [Verrucomicrobiales bacterium]
MTPSRLTPEVQRSNGHGRHRDEDTPGAELRLFDRLARRDVTAMSELYALYSGPIYSFALRALGSREDAEELLQDTFVRLWQRAPDYNPALSRPFTWAFLLARGLCMDRLRRAGRRARIHGMASMADERDVADSARRTVPNVISQDELRHVMRALQTLPAAERRAVEMAVFLEFTGQEIADDLREPLGTIKSRIRRGLKRLRQLLKYHDRS